MATNPDGAFLTIRECLAGMRQINWSRMIPVASIAGGRGLSEAACYFASSHGLIGLTLSLSKYYACTPYSFNAICPGYVDTSVMTRNANGMNAGEALQMMVKANRHKRLIHVDEIAAAMWLVGPESESVNGQMIGIAGGGCRRFVSPGDHLISGSRLAMIPTKFRAITQKMSHFNPGFIWLRWYLLALLCAARSPKTLTCGIESLKQDITKKVIFSLVLLRFIALVKNNILAYRLRQSQGASGYESRARKIAVT